jgi:hypothetical protein
LALNAQTCQIELSLADAMHQIDVGDRDRRISNPLTPGIQQCAASRADGPAQSGPSTSGERSKKAGRSYARCFSGEGATVRPVRREDPVTQ